MHLFPSTWGDVPDSHNTGYRSVLSSTLLANVDSVYLHKPLHKAVDPSVFNDITVGNNPGCGTPGFNATKGWDPITGVGTPNFAKLRDAIAQAAGAV